MRLYAFALVASSANLTRNADSSRVPGSSVTLANLSISVRSYDGVHNGVPIKRLWGVNETTASEERARPPAPVSIVETINKTFAAMATTLHSHDLISKQLTGLTKKHLEAMDVDAIKRYFHKQIKRTSDKPLPFELLLEYLERSYQKITEMPDARNLMIESIRMSQRTHQQEMVKILEAKKTEWLQAGWHPNYVFNKLHIAGDVDRDVRIKPFASPYLEVLKTYIGQYNKMRKKSITLLETFINGFGGMYRLAHLLSIAKLSPIYRPQAQKMQKRLLLTWIRKDMTIDELAKVLGLSEMREHALTYTSLDTISEYASLLDKERPGERPDIFTYLTENFSGLKLATLIQYARTVDASHPQTLEKKLFQNWMERGVEPEALSRAIRAKAGPNVEMDQVIMARFTAFYTANPDPQSAPVLHNLFPH